MITFIKIDKDGKLYNESVDNIENLYKKCGLRKKEGFINLYEHDSNEGKIELWGRNIGRSNIKNSYVFPLNTDLIFYGTIAVVLTKNNNYINLTENMLDIIVKDKTENSIMETSNVDNDNESVSDSDSDNDSDDYSSDLDSELKLEDYVYSSEEEN